MAGEIKAYDRPTYETSQISSIRKQFEINPQLGRAWVNMKFDELGDGLVFNSTLSEILLDVEGTQIVCANVKINFFGVHIKNTGKCTFAQKRYNVETIQKLKISLVY